MAFRASRFVSQSNAARLVSEATRRADSSRPRPTRGLRKHTDLIVVAIATVVAGTAVQRKHQYDEENSMLKSRLANLQQAQDANEQARKLITNNADMGIEKILAVRSIEDRATALRHWINTCYKDAEREVGIVETTTSDDKKAPTII